MEFRIGDCAYRQTSRINAFDQMAIIAKISPLLASGFGELAPLIMKMRKDGLTSLEDMAIDKLGEIATPIATQLAKMSEPDRRFIIGACLGTVERKRDGEVGWAKIWSQEAGRAMFDDINFDFTLMLRIALGVFQETFAGFLPASLSSLIGAKPAPSRSIQ